jgi:hypothetical protein
MKKLIFEILAFAFCLWLLVLVYQEGLTTENNFVFPFALFLLASGITFCMILSTVQKLFSK